MQNNTMHFEVNQIELLHHVMQFLNFYLGQIIAQCNILLGLDFGLIYSRLGDLLRLWRYLRYKIWEEYEVDLDSRMKIWETLNRLDWQWLMCFQLPECTPHYFNVNFKNDYLLTLKIPSNHHVKDIPISRDAIASKKNSQT